MIFLHFFYTYTLYNFQTTTNINPKTNDKRKEKMQGADIRKKLRYF